MSVSSPVLEISGLQTHFRTEHGVVRSVDGIDIAINAGETLGLVGESGCGKSVTSLSIMRLIPSPPGRIVAGSIKLMGEDLLALSETQMEAVRGNVMAMIYQEPMTALNPVHPVGRQIAEPIVVHRGVSWRRAMEQAVELLRIVGMPLPAQRAHEFPHQLSGGMRQRVMIAMALACQPRLLIADEPTTALDVTIQAQILELMKRLRRDRSMAILLITHDLGVVAEMCDRVAVMYAGRIVEQADAVALFDRPLHPYTAGLLASIPRIDTERDSLHAIAGTVPGAHDMPAGCAFAPRCAHALDRCHRERPALETQWPGRDVACFRAAEFLAAGGHAR
jgi:oligopeptide transport system ATP-binding protein